MNFIQEVKFAIRRSIFYVYANIKYFYPMWLLFNREGVNLFKKNTPELNQEQERILKDLQSDGIAVTHINDLFPEEDILKQLQSYEAVQRNQQEQYHKKTFFIDYWPQRQELKLDDTFVKIMLSPRILDVVNSYMGMFSQVVFYTLQMTSVMGREKTYSQNWHRDPQEQRFCKVFIYLNDVDEKTGPFVYIPQSSYGHKYGKLFPQKPPAGVYPDAEKLERLIPKSEWRTMAGKAGTMLFCDTTGLHYGGCAENKPRIMSTFSYGAKTFRENKSYTYKKSLLADINKLPLQSQFAINKNWIER